jgi:hypothetical protein
VEVDGILIERLPGFLSFVKQPYQELFCVRELTERWRARRDDPALTRYFTDRSTFPMTSGMAGLLDPEEGQRLVAALAARPSSRLLAAQSVRHLDGPAESIVEPLLQRAEREVMRLSRVPHRIAGAGFALLVLLVSGVASSYLSLATIVRSTAEGMVAASTDLGLAAGIAAALWIVALAARRLSRRLDQQVQPLPGAEIDGRGGPVLALSLPAVVAFDLPPADRLIGATVALIGGLYLGYQLFTMVAVRGLHRATLAIEEHLVHRQLIPRMELIRELGEHSVAAIERIRLAFASTPGISQRIRDAAERTWAVSARTALRLLDQLDDQRIHAEAVAVFRGVALRFDLRPDHRRRILDGLYRVARATAHTGTAVGALRALREIAADFPESRAAAIAMLKEVLDDLRAPHRHRQVAYRQLAQLGVQGLAYPRRKPAEIVQDLRWPLLLLALLALLAALAGLIGGIR